MKASAAGYSHTPLEQKLGLKMGLRFIAVDAPTNLDHRLAGAPEVKRLTRVAHFAFGFAFATTERKVAAAFAKLAPKMVDSGMLWIAWPKQTSRVATDLTEDVVRRVGLAAKLVDVKVCAIDATWSGLKFVRRLTDRAPCK